MDTRNKIVTPEAARALVLEGPAVATGYFDVLLAGHVRELEELSRRAPGRALVAVVLPLAGAVLGERARAELVAALRAVDWVVVAGGEEAEALARSLAPSATLRMEDADLRRARELREHVRKLHSA